MKSIFNKTIIILIMASPATEFNEYCKIIKQKKSPGKKPETTLLLKPEQGIAPRPILIKNENRQFSLTSQCS